MQNSHFGRLHSRLHSFGHYPRLMPIGENGNKDRAKYSKFCLLRQLSLHDNWTMQSMPYSTCFADSDVHFFILCPVSLVNATPRYLNFSTCFSFILPTCREYCNMKDKKKEKYRSNKLLFQVRKFVNQSIFFSSALLMWFCKTFNNCSFWKHWNSMINKLHSLFD